MKNIFLIASSACEQKPRASHFPEQGWGAYMQRHFDGEINVINRSRSSWSLRGHLIARPEARPGEINKLLDIDTEGKPYYSYKMDGGVFIVLGTERQEFERAYLSDTQLQFLDDELTKAQAEDLPAFVICHQPLKNTHGLPDVWKTGDLGDQSEQVREILTSHENVIFINGHLHDGYYEKSVCELSEGVYSVNLPTYTKGNDFGKTGRCKGTVSADN